MEPALSLALILCVMCVALLFSSIPVDLTALFGLAAIVAVGLVPLEAAFSGFSSPTIITLVCTFIVCAGLVQSGLADRLGAFCYRLAGNSERLNILVVCLLGALISAFMANVAATALLMPAVAALAVKSRVAPSRLFMPLSFAVVLGGTTTLLGTSANLLANDVLRKADLPPFHLLAFTPYSLPMVLVGITVIVVLTPFVLPQRRTMAEQNGSDIGALYQLGELLYTVRIPNTSSFHNQRINALRIGSTHSLAIVAIVRGRHRILAPHGSEILQGNDTLIIRGHFEQLSILINEGVLEFLGKSDEHSLDSEDFGIIEAAISPRSELVGKTLADLNFREKYKMQVLALWRKGQPLTANLHTLTLHFGDALLLLGPRDRFPLLSSERNLLLLSPNISAVRKPSKIPFVVLSLCVLLGLPAFGLIAPHGAAFLAALIILGSATITMTESYQAIDWRMIILVGALLPLGVALEHSGAEHIVGTFLAQHNAPIGTIGMLTLLIIVSSIIGQLLDSVLAVVVLGPVAITLARLLDVAPQNFLLAVGLGASLAFLTPFSHRAHLLVRGAGGYTNRDYFRLGAPLTAATVAVLIVTLLFY
jgi:di/tricarboxylate transporter